MPAGPRSLQAKSLIRIRDSYNYFDDCALGLSCPAEKLWFPIVRYAVFSPPSERDTGPIGVPGTVEKCADWQGSGPYLHPVPFGQQSHLISNPSAIAAEDKGARIDFFRIPFARGDGGRHWIAAGRTLKEKNVNEWFGAFGHGNLPCFKTYRSSGVQPIPQGQNLRAGKTLGKNLIFPVILT